MLEALSYTFLSFVTDDYHIDMLPQVQFSGITRDINVKEHLVHILGGEFSHCIAW